MSDPEIIKKNFPRCPFRASVVLPLQLLLHVTPHRSISRRSSLRTVQLRSRVCVCVCVSVTLTVNSPTGQTPQRIFAVDSLKNADLRKDVPFGGLDDE